MILDALAGGLDGVVEQVRADNTVNMDKLHGFGRYTPKVRLYFVINAFGCQAAEDLNMELFEDVPNVRVN